MVFNGSLSDSKSPQVSRTLLSILVDFNNAALWMISTSALISNFSSLFTKTVLSLLFTLLVFFTSVLVDGFSREFEWQQVSSSLKDSSQYSGRSQ